MQTLNDSEIFWQVGTECKILAVFQNYLSVSLRLDSVQPLFDNLTCSQFLINIYPITVDIPAKTEYYEVELRIEIQTKQLPIIIGGETILKLIGLKIYIQNAFSIIYIDSNGCSVHSDT
jgi:hypothetical protein